MHIIPSTTSRDIQFNERGGHRLDLVRSAVRIGPTPTLRPASATTDLDSTVACARSRTADVLVVWKLDRLGRTLAHLVNTVLTGQGAQIDTTTAAGRLVFGSFAALAEFERELIRERTLAGLTAARAPRRQDVRAVESPGAAGPGRDGAPRHFRVRALP